MSVSSLHSIFVAIPSTVILLCHFAAPYPYQSCKWSFLSCQEESSLYLGYGRECLVTIVKMKDDVICEPRSEKKVKLSHSHAYYQYCSPNSCSILPTWCPWSIWSGSDAECGPESGKQQRTRQLSCHPITGERQTYNAVTLKQTEYRTVDWHSCSEAGEDDRGGNQIDTFVWAAAGVVSTVILVVSIITLLYCLKFRRTQNNRNRTGRRGRLSDHRAVPSAPEATSHSSPRYPTDRAGSRQLIDHDGDQLPPSYEETQSNVNLDAPASPPPQYDAALKLAI